MQLHSTWAIFILMLITSDVWSYGSNSSSKKACDKPRFSEFIPANKAQVAAKSTFSFMVSAGTKPETIAVTVKEQPVDITVTPKNQGFEVTGKLPDTLKETYARINITAEGPNKCKGNDGWLVQVTE